MAARPKGILLDLDDTIISAHQRPADAWRLIIKEFATDHGLEATAVTEAVLTVQRGFWTDPANYETHVYNIRAARRMLVERAFVTLGNINPALAPVLADRFSDYRESCIKPFPGAIETIDALKDEGVRFALITNGGIADQRRKLDVFDLHKRFDCIVISEEVGIFKPEASIFEHALRSLDVAAQECWMVGDDLDRDIAGAQGVGIHGIWHDHEAKGLPEDHPVTPDRIITGLTELL